MSLIFTKKPENKKLNNITMVATNILILKFVVNKAPIKKPIP
jgi:hypothetical protein